MRVLTKQKESQIYKAARNKLYEAYGKATAQSPIGTHIRIVKLSTLAMYGEAGWPDMMIVYKGGVFFIELKRPGEVPNENQANCHAVLRRMGHRVFVCTSVSEAMSVAQEIL